MVSVEVIPLTQAISPGETFEIAVVFSMEEGWHTYWQNPGEAGMPTSFEWQLPDNFKLTRQREPTPKRHVDEGITTFIHQEEAIYMFNIQAPDEVADTNSFSVVMDWLECKDLCQPGASTQHFDLVRGKSSTSIKAEWTGLIERAERHFPQPAAGSIGRLIHSGHHIELVQKRYPWSKKLLEADFFPSDEMIYDSGKPVQIKRGLFRDTIIIPLSIDSNITPEVLSGVLVQSTSSSGGPITTNSTIHEPLP